MFALTCVQEFPLMRWAELMCLPAEGQLCIKQIHICLVTSDGTRTAAC
jgi:hypothetical protein